MSAAASSVSSLRPVLSSLLCRTVPQLRSRLSPGSRIAAVDVTSTHLSVSISDASRESAYPFGILARTPKLSADARILAAAFKQAGDNLNLQGLVVNVSAGDDGEEGVAYLEGVLDENAGGLEEVRGVLFWSEAETLRRSLGRTEDVMEVMKHLKREKWNKMRRYVGAMHPSVKGVQAEQKWEMRANVSVTETLQVVLEQLNMQD